MAKRGRPKGSRKEKKNPKEILKKMVEEFKAKKANEVSRGELIAMIQLINKIIGNEKNQAEITEILCLGLVALSLAIIKLDLENAELRKKLEIMQKPFLLLSGLMSGVMEDEKTLI